MVEEQPTKEQTATAPSREKFGSRLGFLLISAGCAIGLGNVWRFPYIVAQYGGAAFILIYLVFLIAFGIPIMTMEFSVGRASQKSIAESFKVLQPQGKKWHWYGIVGTLGNYLLMMFYTTITGWMLAYLFKTIGGDFVGADASQISTQFTNFVSNPWALIGFMSLATVIGFGVCSLGLKNGVERITKVMMLALLAIIAGLAIYVIVQPGASEGLAYYLIPDFSKIAEAGVGEVIFAAMGQAFFTLSIGMGSMAIFGSYIKKDRKLLGEAISVAAVDTSVAFIAGLTIIPAIFAFGNKDSLMAGPGLIFEVLPNIFNSMGGFGQVFGALFFVFMVFAALSTVIAVFENIVSSSMDKFGWSRLKSCLINCGIMLLLGLPCALGFNALSGFQPLGAGTTVLDLEDFIVSNNILPLGSLVYVLFCTMGEKHAWGWDNFLLEANTGKGLSYPKWLRFYSKYILPVVLIVLWIWGNISFFI
ncbi:MAG: sodium-dependent transporter [Clostridia bacterium]|nr:sodium-dependent transporter [Clostridia bacterium]